MLRKASGFAFYTSRIGRRYRCLSTEADSEAVARVKVPRKTKSITEHEVYIHFNTHSKKAALKYPDDFFKKKRGNKSIHFYIADALGARIIADELKKNLTEDKLMIEVNPGIGMLTEILINETKNDMILYEQQNDLFYEIASIVMKQGQGRKISLKQCDFTALWRMVYMDKLDGGDRVKEVFDKIHPKEFTDDTTARMFACVSSTQFFRDLINSVVFQNGFSSAGRIEMFLCIPPPLFISIACLPTAGYMRYRSTPILFQLLFEYEFITKIDRKLFLPWRNMPTNTPKLGKIMRTDFDYMYLIRVVPRRDLFEHCPLERLPALWFFIKQHLVSRSKAVIPTMEQWIPGCGPRFILTSKPSKQPTPLFPQSDMSRLPVYIAPSMSLSTSDYVKQMHVFTQFGMLSPTQILTIFNEFIHWPEFESCNFSNALEKAQIKTHANEDDDDESSDSDSESESEDITFIEDNNGKSKSLKEILSSMTDSERIK